MKVLVLIEKLKCIVCGFNGIDLKSRNKYFSEVAFNKTDDVRRLNCPKCKSKLELHFKSQFEIKNENEE